MGKGGDSVPRTGGVKTGFTKIAREEVRDYPAAEVLKHTSFLNERGLLNPNPKGDSWIIYRGGVYDISNFAHKHPGGAHLLSTYEGQDATAVMDAFHAYPDRVRSYLKALKIGTCKELAETKPIMKDFEALTAKLRAEGYFEAKVWFFALQYLQVLAWEALAYYLVRVHSVHTWGYGGCIGISILGFILGLANTQGGWLQHDAGHLSIFKNDRANFWAQQMTMNVLCGASTNWWKDRHNRHHAKTNIFQKDPDLRGNGLVAFGDLYYTKTDLFFTPTLWINKIFFVFFAVPSVGTWLFVGNIANFLMKHKLYYDAFFMSLFYIRNTLMYYEPLGIIGGAKMYLAMRIVQSLLFTWITSISHIPLPIIEDDPNLDWVRLQCRGTQNVAGGYFNNWFTGHLNYQIEHHLWPQMPRHSYPYVQKHAKELCRKYDVEYLEIPNLWTGCFQITSKLDRVGARFKVWYRNQRKQKKEKAI